MNSRAFGEIIRSERMKRGITQAELAKKSGFTREAVSYWENGHKSISLENADKLADTLSIEIIIGAKE